MTEIIKGTTQFALVAVLIQLITACSAVRESEAKQMEQLLTSAGFEIKPADSEHKLEQLQKIKQRTMIVLSRDDKYRYIYADALFCQCLYQGTEESYHRYRMLVKQQQLQDDKIAYAGQEEAEPLNWDPLGNWDQGN